MDELEVAAYLDRRLPEDERSRLEGHLAGCRACREELIELELLRHRLRRPGRLAVAAAMATAAAAAVVFVVWPGIGARDKEAIRGTQIGNALVAYGPIGETSLESIRFVWGAAPHATTYRLTVSNSGGIILWSGSAADTAAVLPDSVILRRGDSYAWMADALLEDGTTRSTGLREFQPQ